jgi:predicted nucleotidyltransferase
MGSSATALSPSFRRFLARARRQLRPDRIVLFGSRARGTAKETSDYDLVIVASIFHGVPWVQRAPMVIRLWDLPCDLDAICLTPEEYRRRSDELSIIGVAVREGVALLPR